MVIKILFIYLFIDYLIFIALFFYLSFLFSNLLKFFITIIFTYNIDYFYIDFLYKSTNNTHYDNLSNCFILDYEYFDLINTINYHPIFFFNNDQYWHYFYYMYNTKNREDDDHEFYRLLSKYQFSDLDKYYVVEHYMPNKEGDRIVRDFYDLDDLIYEFTFFSKEYLKFLDEYKFKYDYHYGTVIYKKKLYKKTINYNYFYTENNYGFYRQQEWNSFLENSRNQYIKKKEVPKFALSEPTEEMSIKHYINWWLFKKEYDNYKFEYDLFISLSPYEWFDRRYYDLFSPNHLFDSNTNILQTVEHRDEYFFPRKNHFNGQNYYYSLTMFFKKLPFDFLNFNHYEIVLLVFIYLFIIFSFLYIIVLVLTSWFCFGYPVYCIDYPEIHYDFKSYFNYTRMLSRTSNLDYINYNKFIFDLPYSYYIKKNDQVWFHWRVGFIANLSVEDRWRLMGLRDGRGIRFNYSKFQFLNINGVKTPKKLFDPWY